MAAEILTGEFGILWFGVAAFGRAGEGIGRERKVATKAAESNALAGFRLLNNPVGYEYDL